MQLKNKVLWLDVASHVAISNQSESIFKVAH